jgi:hypothetical protein
MAGSRSPVGLAVAGLLLLALGFLLGRWTATEEGRGSGDAARSAAGTAGGGVASASSDSAKTPPGGSLAVAGSAAPPAATEGSSAPAKDGAPEAAADPVSATAAPGTLAAAGSPAAAGVALSPYVLPARIHGRLVDGRTGKPIPGAAVSLLWHTADGTRGGGIDGIEVGEDGSFAIEPRQQMRGIARWIAADTSTGEHTPPDRVEAEAARLLEEMEYDVRGTAKGYETVEKGDPGESVEVALEPESRERLPGAIRVVTRMPDGSPWRGLLLAEFWGDDRKGFSQWTWPDPDGTFLLEGVPVGKWSVRVAGRGDSGSEVHVLEAAETRTTLRVPRKGVQQGDDAPAAETREVEVGGIPPDAGAGAFLRAEPRPGLFFRRAVLSGSAAFPALPVGKWTFVLQAPDRPEQRFPAEVPAGVGKLWLSFVAR